MHVCPVCGYPGFDRDPIIIDAAGKFGALDDYCPSCGFQFGFHDLSEHIPYQQWRARWIADGCRWQDDPSDGGIPRPAGWDPRHQLDNLQLVPKDVADQPWLKDKPIP